MCLFSDPFCSSVTGRACLAQARVACARSSLAARLPPLNNVWHLDQAGCQDADSEDLVPADVMTQRGGIVEAFQFDLFDLGGVQEGCQETVAVDVCIPGTPESVADEWTVWLARAPK
ncbi:unnamed protein product [Prorocentrum cordatum]|uniref:Uncharacterized protein n=1 Tax=Prorocentrum cordatum TaxID=2364126 RepID=A0ABN9U160_9DINO|nr:unnamed protein product [Polarella glacialis]